MSEQLVTLRDVGICYRASKLLGENRKNWALKNISLELNRGDTLGVIGRNGVGKSTLLKLLADIIKPDEGEITRLPCRATLLSLRVGFLNHLDARQNAIMAGMLLGLSRREIEGKLDSIIEFAELQDYVNVPIGTYSTGMVARLGFSIAMQIDPEILLIDEMLAVGDAGFREKSAAALRERMRSDRTVVLVAHNEQVVCELCTRVVWIEEGRMREIGEPNSVLESYHSFMQNRKSEVKPN